MSQQDIYLIHQQYILIIANQEKDHTEQNRKRGKMAVTRSTLFIVTAFVLFLLAALVAGGIITFTASAGTTI